MLRVVGYRKLLRLTAWAVLLPSVLGVLLGIYAAVFGPSVVRVGRDHWIGVGSTLWGYASDGSENRLRIHVSDSFTMFKVRNFSWPTALPGLPGQSVVILCFWIWMIAGLCVGIALFLLSRHRRIGGCKACGYSLDGLAVPRTGRVTCPECGASSANEGVGQ
jgi:hypothetical protein